MHDKETVGYLLKHIDIWCSQWAEETGTTNMLNKFDCYVYQLKNKIWGITDQVSYVVTTGSNGQRSAVSKNTVYDLITIRIAYCWKIRSEGEVINCKWGRIIHELGCRVLVKNDAGRHKILTECFD